MPDLLAALTAKALSLAKCGWEASVHVTGEARV